MEELKYIRPVTWSETLASWGEGEAQLPRWIEHYKKRGFGSWEEWRSDSVKDLHPEKLNWTLYEIVDNSVVVDFYAGPFRSWQKKYYGNKDILQFKELAQNSNLQNDSNINEIIENFPKESVLIGLQKGSRIIIIEGMHRCSALAVSKEKGNPVDFKLCIILAEYLDELPTLGQANSPT